ncbi:branched-chain amino acid ABC transporter permease [Lonsdalea iberica]|uniref:Branched-chain amino acid ABC transporter permease n=1 Tax=Lonsdalea iberica TaxID=1082703 RepID=A0A1X3RVT1_9GAMM|nr:AzlC family ABC transporter permease [Lonsdalea iberica]OSN06038.1 branched-chain amino acid ABC transporter permease [Lonsdalea iberica]OSN06099.1 branched-chain amino acid ABC transporter permease [Lonsdalea iberica]
MNASATPRSPWQGTFTGCVAVLPLCLAVVPWGILAGSMAVQAGLTFWQSVGMSAVIFAGAAQLVTLGLLMSGASVLTIVMTVFVITLQHLIYGLTLRDAVSRLSSRFRIPIGFLLTDELFALAAGKDNHSRLSPGYLIGAGLTFYLCWVMCSLSGILLASSIPDLERYHLDFSIVATFITIIVPMVKNIGTLCGVAFSLIAAMLLSYWQVEGAVIIGGLGGMLCAVVIERLGGASS